MTVPTLAETAAAFDVRAQDYDASSMHRHVAARAVDAADPQRGELLLDLAGGTGLVARGAVDRGARALVLDASLGMLRRAGLVEPRLLRVRADAHRIPLCDGSVDAVTCVTALHLFADPAGALREAGRVTRMRGRVVFTTWAADGWSASRLLREVAHAHGIEVTDRYAVSGTAAGVAELAQASGLAVEDVQLVQHVEPRTEDAASTWRRVTAGCAPLSPHVEAAFASALGDQVEHRLLIATCRPRAGVARPVGRESR